MESVGRLGPQPRWSRSPRLARWRPLLQERIPDTTAFYSQRPRSSSTSWLPAGAPEIPIRVFKIPDTPNPEVQLLSKGQYHVMVTQPGGGYSRWKDLAVTNWREDRTRDNWGTFCYLRNVTGGEFWFTAYPPTLKRSTHFEAIFSEGRAEFHC
jgi:cellobiose phosphorylase